MSQTLKLYIPKVLSENKIVLLKGIGTLQMNYRPAEIDLEAGIMDAPREEIFFIPSNESKLDPVLIRVVEIIARVDEDEAADLVENFMNELQVELAENGFLTFPNIGWIKQDHWGSLFFEPAAEYISINKFFGFGKVKLPEALSPAEQEVIADLKETVAEKAERDSIATVGSNSRNWGFIIGGGLILIMLMAFSFLLGDGKDKRAPGVSGLDLTGEMVLIGKQELNDDHNVAPDSHRQVVPTDAQNKELDQKSESEEGEIAVEGLDELLLDQSNQSGCLIIVGAFREENNVDRMVDRIASDSNYECVVIAGPKLTKVGLRYLCDDDPQNTLAWAQANIDEEAWLYKID